MVYTVDGDPLTEVRLEAVYTHVEQRLQLVLIPPACFRVGEVYQRHARLPHIPLPYVAVRPLYEISVLFSFCKKDRLLADVGIDPHADV